MNDNCLTQKMIASIRTPVNGTFELTQRCNLNCKMCLFRHEDSETPEMIKKELSAQQWDKLAEQAAEAGTVSLLLTGGEAMIRADFPEVYERIYRHGFYLTLYTNATMVTPRVMEVLEKYPPHKIGVTIYGASAETYEKACGDGRAFGRMLKGIELLRTLPSEMEYRTTIISANYDDLPRMEELVREKYKSALIHTEVVFPAVRGGANHPERYRLPSEKMAELRMERMERLLQRMNAKLSRKENEVLQEEIKSEEAQKDKLEKIDFSRLTLFGCAAGIRDYTIAWDGGMLPCQLVGSVRTDALSDGFRAAWEELPLHAGVTELPEKCLSCEYGSQCSNCIAVREAENKDRSVCPEYECKLTKARIEYKEKLKERL